MSTITVAMHYDPEDGAFELAEAFASNPAVESIVLVASENRELSRAPADLRNKARVMRGDFFSGPIVNRLLDEMGAGYLLAVAAGERIAIGPRSLERLISAAEDSGAGLTYSDFRDDPGASKADHPLIDYRLGSLRDTFDFGSMFLLSKQAADSARGEFGEVDEKVRFAGWYDLRLKLSVGSALMRIPEPLYARVPTDRRASGDRQFDYLDPGKREYQLEMETVATDHLKRIGAYLAPEFEKPPRSDRPFPVPASVVIPVRNRERTIKDAVASALSQRTSFDFNVIVVDNHSTDRTSEILSEFRSRDSRLIHLKPSRRDLGIGGCWNEAIYSEHCGEYAVQLDSDDLYSDEHTLARIIAKFDEGPYAMVIGSYTIVNYDLQTIPPGLIDHREWTRDNGRNNALRVNGLGAPRAFRVPLLREIGFPNTSYGEDYAVALRLSRRYEIGRIYESIYFARRWEGNSDAALSVDSSNRYDAYKDHLRTVEIIARQNMNRI